MTRGTDRAGQLKFLLYIKLKLLLPSHTHWRSDKVLVKRLRFDGSHNSWIDKSKLIWVHTLVCYANLMEKDTNTENFDNYCQMNIENKQYSAYKIYCVSPSNMDNTNVMLNLLFNPNDLSFTKVYVFSKSLSAQVPAFKRGIMCCTQSGILPTYGKRSSVHLNVVVETLSWHSMMCHERNKTYAIICLWSDIGMLMSFTCVKPTVKYPNKCYVTIKI